MRSPDREERERAPLRAMTFNILYDTARNPAGSWSQRRPLVRDIVRRWQPDVIGMQEVTRRQLDDLREDLPDYGMVVGVKAGQSRMPYWAVTVSPALAAAWLAARRARPRGDRDRGWSLVSRVLLLGAAVPVLMALDGLAVSGSALIQGEFCPILYRKERIRRVREGILRLSAPADDPISILRGDWLPRAVTWTRFETADGEPFTVYNTHFDWMPWMGKRSCRLLREHLDRTWDGAPQIVLGDFNVELDGDAAQFLTSMDFAPGSLPPLRSAWDEAERCEGPEETCHLGTGEGLSTGRTDHILVRGALGIERVVTVDDHEEGRYPSDHYPVVADLSHDAGTASAGARRAAAEDQVEGGSPRSGTGSSSPPRTADSCATMPGSA